MSEMILQAVRRVDEKHSARIARQGDFVPGVFYEKGNAAISISINKKELRPLIYTKERSIVDLQFKGDSTVRKCVLKDYQIHPVTDELVHFDLMGVSEDTFISVEVPVHFVGQAVGVRDGGTFQPLLHSLHVTAKPQHLPSHIEVNIANLKIGESILLKAAAMENVKFSEADTLAIATVMAAKTDLEAEGGAAAEPEVVGKKGKKDEA